MLGQSGGRENGGLNERDGSAQSGVFAGRFGDDRGRGAGGGERTRGGDGAGRSWPPARSGFCGCPSGYRQAIGSVVGLGGFAGAAGGVLLQRLTGKFLESSGSNCLPVFMICGSAYVTALLIIHLLAPRMEPVTLTTV